MAIQIHRGNVSSWKKLAERGERAIAHAQRLRKHGEHVMEKVLRTAETSGTAFGLGLLNGYHGPITVAKVPLELLLAAGFELGGYLGLAGKHSDHLNSIGDGALSTFAVIKGVQIGSEMKAKHSGGGQATTTKGVSGPSRDEMRAMIDAAVAAKQAVPVGG